jgi:hypothetical protein
MLNIREVQVIDQQSPIRFSPRQFPIFHIHLNVVDNVEHTSLKSLTLQSSVPLTIEILVHITISLLAQSIDSILSMGQRTVPKSRSKFSSGFLDTLFLCNFIQKRCVRKMFYKSKTIYTVVHSQLLEAL